MDRTHRARIALTLALLVGCGDPPAGDSEAATTTAGLTTTGSATEPATSSVPTTTDAAATDEAGSGGGEGDDSTGAPACDVDAVPVHDRGFIPRGESRTDVVLPACSEDRWYFAAASESTVEVTLRRRDGGLLTAAIAYPDEPLADVWAAALVDPLVSAEQPASVIFPVPRSGEFAIHVRADDVDFIDAPAGYDLEIRCVLGCERETTRFPVLLVHGWTGFEAIGPLTYFYNVVVTLEQLGYPVAVAVLDPYNHTSVRSGQLAVQIDETLVEWRARKVDLLGHSQGGIDSRAAVSSHGRGDVVSVVLTVASPHRGTYLTDVALGLAPGAAEQWVGALLNFVGAVTAQQKSDAIASFYSLSEEHMQDEFNPQNPDDPRVKYISYTGRTCDGLAYLNPENNCQDLCDPLIAWAYRMLKDTRGDNDGLVTLESAKWGEYRGEMIADHIDEVGQIAGVTDLKFDHLAFYRDRARDLAAEQH